MTSIVFPDFHNDAHFALNEKLSPATSLILRSPSHRSRRPARITPHSIRYGSHIRGQSRHPDRYRAKDLKLLKALRRQKPINVPIARDPEPGGWLNGDDVSRRVRNLFDFGEK